MLARRTSIDRSSWEIELLRESRSKRKRLIRFVLDSRAAVVEILLRERERGKFVGPTEISGGVIVSRSFSFVDATLTLKIRALYQAKDI